jgi:hypothetical protein
LKLKHDAEMKTLVEAHRRDKEVLVQRNRELRNIVRSLKVSAAYILTSDCFIIGCYYFFIYHRTICMTIAYASIFEYEAAKVPELVLSLW